MSKHPEFGAAYPVRDIGLSCIEEPPGRMRELRPEAVEALAESMKEAGGLINPITVRPQAGAGYCLVAGLHRLRAAKKLRWVSIKCFVRQDLDDDGATLVEIDENLIRADLTAEEKRNHLLRRKAIWEKRHGAETGASCATLAKGGRGKKSFAADTVAATGLSKSQVNRILAEPKPKPAPRPRPTVTRDREEQLAKARDEASRARRKDQRLADRKLEVEEAIEILDLLDPSSAQRLVSLLWDTGVHIDVQDRIDQIVDDAELADEERAADDPDPEKVDYFAKLEAALQDDFPDIPPELDRRRK